MIKCKRMIAIMILGSLLTFAGCGSNEKTDKIPEPNTDYNTEEDYENNDNSTDKGNVNEEEQE